MILRNAVLDRSEDQLLVLQVVKGSEAFQGEYRVFLVRAYELALKEAGRAWREYWGRVFGNPTGDSDFSLGLLRDRLPAMFFDEL